MKNREMIEKYYEFAEQNRYEEGIAFLEDYIQNAGDSVSAEVFAVVGNDVLMYTDELEKGIGYFHKAMELEPENPDIYWSYFTDLEEITNEHPETIDDAIHCLTKIIEILSKIETEEDLENLAEYDYIDEEFDKEGDIACRYGDLAEMYKKKRDYEKAEEFIEKALAIEPDDSYFNFVKMEILTAKGRGQEADVAGDEEEEDDEDIDSTGWDAIVEAFEELYPGQKDPKHYGVLIPWSLGGKDPLDGISIYDGGDYWHFVSFGLSELYEKESENLEYSGFGMELTLKLKKGSYDVDGELACVCGIFQQIARLVFNGEMFYPYEYLYTGQTQGMDSQGQSNITGFITVPEPKRELINTPNGKVELLEFIGVTDAELQAIMNKEFSVKELYEKLGSDITAYDRESLV